MYFKELKRFLADKYREHTSFISCLPPSRSKKVDVSESSQSKDSLYLDLLPSVDTANEQNSLETKIETEWNQALIDEVWGAKDICLTCNRISKLPNNPACTILENLELQSNKNLLKIPSTFFDNMPRLQTLNLSGTSLKCLPDTICKLKSLQKLIIRNCDLLKELPPEIGKLENLKVFDSEGTRLVCLPGEFGGLINLISLTFSLSVLADRHKGNKPIVPAEELSKMISLMEINIVVDYYCKWWEDEVLSVIGILPLLPNLKSLKIFLPTIQLLDSFLEKRNSQEVPLYQYLNNFVFIVGGIEHRMIPDISNDLDEAFLKLQRVLRYTKGDKGDTEVISRVLKYAHALYIDRHWTLPSLSTFGPANMENLRFCLLIKCNELLDIANERYLESSSRPVLGSLEFLSLHFMKSLTCIWNGGFCSGSLSNLKTLAIHTCPELRTVFTEELIHSLTCLENLVLEDCRTVSSLLVRSSGRSNNCLPSLKRMSLVDLPQLVSIFHGLITVPRLESLVISYCPKLKELSYKEVRHHIKEVKAESEWWDSLTWSEPGGRPDHLASVFIPIEIKDINDAYNLESKIFDNANNTSD